MKLDVNTSFSRSKCGLPKTLRKRSSLREGRILIPIEFIVRENSRLPFFCVLVDKLVSVLKIEVTNELEYDKRHCFYKEPKNWRNTKLFIFLLSGSIVSWPIGSVLGGATTALAHPVDSLPRQVSVQLLTDEKTKNLPCPANSKLLAPKALTSSRVISSGDSCNETVESVSIVSPLNLRSRLLPHESLAESDFTLAAALLPNTGMTQQNSIGVAAEELGYPIEKTTFSPLSKAVIPVAVSLWKENFHLPNVGGSIGSIDPDATKYPELPKNSENLPALIPIDLLSQVQQINQKQTQQQQRNPSTTPGSNSQSPSTGEQPESPDAEVDPDLGRLRLRERRVPPRQPQPVLHIIPRISYFYTNNVFSGVDPVEDSLYFPSITLWSTPKLGPRTYLTASVDGNLIRYLNESQFDYNLLRFRTGIYQRLTSRMAGEIGWNNQQYFRASTGDRFLDEHFIYLTLSRRDWLNRRLALDSFYDARLSFANPDNRSRLINYLSVSLSYYFQRNLVVGMDYQFSFSDFTKRDREDYYHRLLGRLSYGVSQDSQINLQGGVTLGGSTDPNIDFDSLFLSVTYSVDLKVF